LFSPTKNKSFLDLLKPLFLPELSAFEIQDADYIKYE
jgi:hypothetical protein